MKQTLLPQPRFEAEQTQRKLTGLCILVSAAAVILNLLLTLLHTRQTHTLMLILNIVVDLAAGWSVAWLLTEKLLPLRKLLSLEAMEGRTVSGIVEAYPDQTERYYDMDCRTVTVGGQKLFVVDNGTISFASGQLVTVCVVHGIVKEVMQ